MKGVHEQGGADLSEQKVREQFELDGGSTHCGPSSMLAGKSQPLDLPSWCAGACC